MKQYTKHGLMFLTKRYKSVLLKCALMNAMAAAVMLTGIHTASAAPDQESNYWARTENKSLSGSAITSLPADLWASGQNTLTVTGDVGGSGMLNINYDMMGEGYAAELTGTVILNGALNLTGEWGGINMAGGTLIMNQAAANSTMGFFGAYGGTLDMRNNHVGDVLTIGKISGMGAPMNVAVDFNAATGVMDKLTIASVEGTPKLKLSSVNVTADGNATSATWMDGTAVSAGDVTDSTTTVTSAGNTYTFTKSANGVVTVSTSGAPIIPPTKTLAESIADSSVDAFSAVGDVSVDSNLGTLAGASRNFTIYGNNHVINGGNHAGVTVASGQTLNVNKATMSNFGSYAITNAGTANLSDSVFNSAIVNTGTVNISGTVTLNAALNGTVNSTGTMILGANADLDGAALSGGTLKLTLPATAVDSAIVNASSASNVSLDLDMTKVDRENAVQYVLTATNTGYTLVNVNNNRYRDVYFGQLQSRSDGLRL